MTTTATAISLHKMQNYTFDPTQLQNKSLPVYAATATCPPNQYTLSYDSITCSQCPQNQYRTILSQYTPYLPMSFKWDNADWSYTNRNFGVYHWAGDQYPEYPVYHTPFWPRYGVGGCAWFWVEWMMYYSGDAQSAMDGYNCPVGGGGFLPFVENPELGLSVRETNPAMPSALAAATNIKWCKDCPANLVCPAGSYISYTCTLDGFLRPAECTRCDPGKYTTTTGQSSCLSCPAGTYYDKVGASSCTPCSPGTFSAAGATSCSPCATGSYGPCNGNSACIPCGPGTYSNTTGNSLCTLCESGTVNPSTGVSSCVECANGHFAPVMGMTQCTACINE